MEEQPLEGRGAKWTGDPQFGFIATVKMAEMVPWASKWPGMKGSHGCVWRGREELCLYCGVDAGAFILFIQP
jgi:hypothetical protein